MKYMERGGFQGHPLMRLTLGLAIGLLSLFWVTNLGLFVSRLGLTPKSIAAYYLGSLGDGDDPGSIAATLDHATDVDWFAYDGLDNFGLPPGVAPGRTLRANGPM